ncbi:cyclin-dependent kinase 12 isoform X1 [Fundulus heteroclitus]|uniref:cyclin-dependent kinase 12 isoform X1 n=1 Tax=Fundulus heteroclitus TaxID=8078 RepID=UPI00165BD616|nr:cyclin-dependent kinase 12 isoform X1 [Fundulus heteroclitus]XP_035992987.1 cyclin-dependent kinase 12 isoform X1 [Fundulus heteroclitus]
MYSKGSDYSYGRQDNDRNSRRKWDDYDDRREERRDVHSNTSRDSYYKYSRDGHSSRDRLSKGKEYTDSPKRLCSSDTASRDWSRRSPARRRKSPTLWDAPEEKRRRLTEEDDADYRYKRDSPEKTHRVSPAGFSRNQQFRYSPSCEGDAGYRKTSPYSRSRHQREEFPPKNHYEDFRDRDSADDYEASAYRKRIHGYSQERTLSPDHTTRQVEAQMRERRPSPSTSAYYDGYYENRATAPQNGSAGQSFERDATPQSAALPEDKSSKGFQRFLDVLNKGVNVDVLTQIVSQNPTPLCDGRISPRSFVNVAARRWSPGRAEGNQKPYKDDSYWNENKGSLRSPRQRHGSASPNRNPAPVGENFRGRKSPSVEEMTMTAEDLQKHKQMRDVLQAIGVDLGFEELGQMSHRIQERLYGKKENEGVRKLSRERSVGQSGNAGRRSRSSSSRRSFTPPRQGGYAKQEPFSEAQDLRQQSEYSSELNRKSSQGDERRKANPVTSAPLLNALPLNPMHAVTQLPPPRMPTMPPAPSVPPYPPISQLPVSFPTVAPPPLPFFPRVGPGIFFPRVPPMLSPSLLPPPNVPPLLSQWRPALPPQLQLLNPTNVNAQQAMNTMQTSKARGRHRFLQIIK